MVKHRSGKSKPVIVVGKSEHARLTGLAEGALDRSPEVAEELLQELERARVVIDARVGDDIIRMGSTAAYKTEAGDERTVTLVYPGEADIAAGKVSILTPIGVALLGLAPGQTMSWRARDGIEHRLTIQQVSNEPRHAS